MSGDISGAEIGYRERAAFYAVEYQDSGDRAFLESCVTPEVETILEVPCGAGRNALWLAATGRQVVAADIEAEMLDALAARFPGAKCPENLETALCDMRDFDLGRRFDLILVPREAIQVLDSEADVAATLATLRRHLSETGRLVIDLASFGSLKPGTPESLLPSYFDPRVADGMTVEEWARPLGDGRTLARSRRQWDLGAEGVRVELSYELHATGVSKQRWRSAMTLRRYSASRFRALAGDAGLSVHALHGDYERKPYAGGDARLIFVLGA